MGLSDSIIRQALSDSSGEQLVMQEIEKVGRLKKEKEAFLSDPSKIDNLASEIVGQFAPSPLLPKGLSKFASKAEGIDSGIPEDHPFAGMGVEVKRRLAEALKHPEFQKMEMSDVIQGVTDSFLMEPMEDGRPRLEKAFKYKREKDASLKLGLNPFAEDPGVRKLPGYDDWLKAVQDQEDEEGSSHSYFADWDDLKEAGLWGAGAGAIFGALGGGVGAVPGAGVGAAAGVALEIFAHPVRRAIEGSEWYKSKVASDSGFETLKAEAFKIGTDVGLGFVGAGAGAKALRSGLRKAAEAGKITEESFGRFFKTGKAADAIKLGMATRAEKLAVEKSENILENIARDDVYDSAASAVEAIRKARGVEAGEAAVQRMGRDVLNNQVDSWIQKTQEARFSFTSVLDEIRKKKQPLEAKVDDWLTRDTAPTPPKVEPTVLKVKPKNPKALFSELTDDGAKKAIEEGTVSGNLDEAILAVHAEEAVVNEVVKKEATDFIELLTKKKNAGKPIKETDKARAVLQEAGYDLEEISSMEGRKLKRLANAVSKKKKPPVEKSPAAVAVSKVLDSDGVLPVELLPEAQGIALTAEDFARRESVFDGLLEELDEALPLEEAFDEASYKAGKSVVSKKIKQEVDEAVSDAERLGYLESMLKAGEDKADELIQSAGPVTSSRAIDLPAVEGRATPQEALIDDFIFDKLDAQYSKKYGDQFGYWMAPEHYGKDFIPDKAVQHELNQQYKLLQQKYGYDLKAMPGSKKKAILSYAKKEGYENVEFEDEVKAIRSMFDGVKLLGAGGAAIVGAMTVSAFDFLRPKEAEAGGLDGIGKSIPKVVAGLVKKTAGVSEEAKMTVLQDMKKAGFIPGEIKAGQKTVPLDYFGKQFHIAADAKSKGVKAGDMVARRKALPFGIHNMMSPTGIANLFYKTGHSVAVQRAHLQTLWAVHTRDVMGAVDNIMKDVPGGKSAADEIAKITAPFVDDYAVVEASRAMEHRLESMEKAIDKLVKRSYGKKVGPKTMEDLERSLQKAELGRDLLRKEVARFKPQVDAFNSKFGEVEQQIAKRFPSARVFYASEDTADFSVRPWLKGMVSYEEQVAAGHIKDLMETYALRMLEGHHRVITDAPYMHHAFHPKYSSAKANELLSAAGVNANSTAPFLKFYKRSEYSRAFIPDAQYALSKYIPDAEKRILTSDFWRKSGPKEYRAGGWYAHMRSPVVQFNKSLTNFWSRMWTADEPEMRTVGNRVANWYTAFETAALIGFSPATAFKHVFKNLGTWGQLGFGASMSHIPDAAGSAMRNYLSSGQVQDGILMSSLRKLGVNTARDRRVVDKFADAMTHQNRMLHHMADMQLPTMDPGVANKVDKALFAFNQKGSFMVAAIESFDRAHSFHAALDMAATKGMTGTQALYGIFDTILKNNFLGGGLNPGWMRSPAVRAIFLFQNTPFKILERRLVNGINSWQDVKTAFGVVKKQDLKKTLSELKALSGFVKKGSDELKENLIRDALTAKQDIFGTPVTKQFMREFIYTGATIYGLGGLFDADFHPHAFHLPFVSSFGGDKPELMVSPITTAIYKGLTRKRESVDETGQEVGWVSQFFQDWLGKKQLVPQTFYKLNRISEDDIPEVYKDSKFRYLFAVPSKSKE